MKKVASAVEGTGDLRKSTIKSSSMTIKEITEFLRPRRIMNVKAFSPTKVKNNNAEKGSYARQ